jgi:hypothetical protein
MADKYCFLNSFRLITMATEILDLMFFLVLESGCNRINETSLR